MNEFVASNGKRIELESDHLAILDTRGHGVHYLLPEYTVALREFFLAERDAELGRWRSKEHPEYVVHEHGDGRVRVMRELDGSSYSFDRESVHRFYPHCDAEVDFQRIAREFFAAHPEPKPWHDAQPGEVWLLEVLGLEDEFLRVQYRGERWLNAHTGLVVAEAENATAGRRIWPEVQS